MTRPRRPSKAAWGSRADLIGKAHVAPASLGLADDVRRAVQLEQTGKESCKEMSATQLRKLLRHYESLGWKPKRPGGRAGAKPVPNAITPRVKKIKALWLTLRDLGELRDASPKALRHYLERQVQVSSEAWLTPELADQAIEALKAWVTRIERKRQAEEQTP